MFNLNTIEEESDNNYNDGDECDYDDDNGYYMMIMNVVEMFVRVFWLIGTFSLVGSFPKVVGSVG